MNNKNSSASFEESELKKARNCSGCHCEAFFAEAISTSLIGDRFGGKASPRDDTWSFLHNE